MPIDKHGNTISKADAEANKTLAADRAAAKARRAAKLAASEAAPPPEAAPKKEKKVKKPSAKDEKELVRIRKKIEEGEDLTSKEKRLLKKFGVSQVSEEAAAQDAGAGGGDALPKYWDRAVKLVIDSDGKSGDTAGDGDGSSKKGPPTIYVESFSVEAGDSALMTNAMLRLVGGKRYGLLGANGCGKSTLLRLLASNRLPLPPRMSVVLVEQEVEASETMSVTEQVLAADEERAKLIAEEQSLTEAIEAADKLEQEAEEAAGLDANGEATCAGEASEAEVKGLWDTQKWLATMARLEEVSAGLEACGGWSAEATVSRILAGLGFTRAMAAAPTVKLSGGWRMRVALAR